MRIDGKGIAAEIFEGLKKRVGELAKNPPAGGQAIIPHLVIILVGDDPASVAYVRQKELKAAEIGAKATILNYESGITNQELLKKIKELNNDNNVHGIIVQRPLPPQINSNEINLATDPKKDIDAFHAHTQFKMPLAAAVIKILKKVYENIGSEKNFESWLKEKNIAVLGKGETGGKPIIEKLKKINIEPAIIDSKTENPGKILQNADIVISAIGKSHNIDFKKIKNGAILICVGMYRGADGKLHGDYEEKDIKNTALQYSPVPGGVGPVNVAMLLENLVLAAEKMQKMQPQFIE